jgi:hypothetical protein
MKSPGLLTDKERALDMCIMYCYSLLNGETNETLASETEDFTGDGLGRQPQQVRGIQENVRGSIGPDNPTGNQTSEVEPLADPQID